MKDDSLLLSLQQTLSLEGGYTQDLNAAWAAKKVHGVRTRLLEHVREVSRSGDLSLIIAAERTIVEQEI